MVLRTVPGIVITVLAGAFAGGCSPAAAQTPRGTTGVATSADGVRIAYETLGKGPLALVFVHGWSCDRSYWNEQLAHFGQRYRVVAMDLAGHGASGAGRRDWSIEAFGGDVAAVVRHLGLRRVILIGHSMGGDVIAEAARRLPGRVAGLVWVDSYKRLGPGRSPEEVQALVGKLRGDFRDSSAAFVRSMFLPASDPRLVERVAGSMSSRPPAIAIPSLESAQSYSRQMPATLERLRLPVIAINPDNAPTDVGSMRRYGVEVTIMPGVGHFLHMEDPDRFDRLLEQAVARLAH